MFFMLLSLNKIYMCEVVLKKIFKLIGNLLVVVSMVFIIRKLLKMNINLESFFGTPKVVRLCFILIAYTLMLLVQYLPWKMIIESMVHIRLHHSNVNYIFLKASLMKYIPGNVFQYVGREAVIGEDEKLNLINVTSSMILEAACLFAASALIGVFGAWDYLVSKIDFKWFFVSGIIVILIVMVLIFLYVYNTGIRQFLTSKCIIPSWKLGICILLSILFLVASFLIQILFFVIVTNIISGNNYMGEYGIIAGGYAASWLLGYFTPGASGGIGIREFAMGELLGGIISYDSLMVSLLVFRIINIFADVLAFAVIFIYVSFNIKQNNKNGNSKEKQLHEF